MISARTLIGWYHFETRSSFKRIGRVDNGISKSVNCRKCRHKYQEPTIQTVLRFGPFFLILSKLLQNRVFCSFWVSQKLKLGARRSEKSLSCSLIFFSIFISSFYGWKKSLESLTSQKPSSVRALSPGISIFILFLINRAITKWEWGERSS